MDKKVVVHIHNEVLLSYKKEQVWVSSNEVDETGACFTEEVRKKVNQKVSQRQVSKSEVSQKEKYQYSILIHIYGI